jgi:hypothetical protein
MRWARHVARMEEKKVYSGRKARGKETTMKTKM